MAEVISSPSPELVADLPIDLESPNVPVLGASTAIQSTVTPTGRTTLILSWAGAPFRGEPIAGELLGTATGLLQVVESAYDPVLAGSYGLFEMSAAETDATTLTAAAGHQTSVLPVVSSAGYAPGDFVRIGAGSSIEFGQVASVDVGVLNLQGRLQFDHVLGSSTAKVTGVQRTEGVDYTVNLTTGQVTLTAAAFAAGSRIVLSYQSADIGDLAGYEVWRVLGTGPLDATYDAVVALSGVEQVATLSGTANGYSGELLAAENGTSWTYYVFAKDDEVSANWSPAARVLVDVLPTIPTNVLAVVGNNKVNLSWDAITDPNAAGVDIYRCTGPTFVKAEAQRLNTTPVASTQFMDGEENSTNRVGYLAVPFPQNNIAYSYALETVDTDSVWTTGTSNESLLPLRTDVFTAVQ